MSSVRRTKLPRTGGTEDVIPREGVQDAVQINRALECEQRSIARCPSQALSSHRCCKATKARIDKKSSIAIVLSTRRVRGEHMLRGVWVIWILDPATPSTI